MSTTDDIQSGTISEDESTTIEEAKENRNQAIENDNIESYSMSSRNRTGFTGQEANVLTANAKHLCQFLYVKEPFCFSELSDDLQERFSHFKKNSMFEKEDGVWNQPKTTWWKLDDRAKAYLIAYEQQDPPIGRFVCPSCYHFGFENLREGEGEEEDSEYQCKKCKAETDHLVVLEKNDDDEICVKERRY